MGLQTNRQVREAKLKKREAKAAKKRNEGTRKVIVRFLIVCEGEKTEPNYFEKLVDSRHSKVREVKIEGKGCSTCKLIQEALRIKQDIEATEPWKFDHVWVVFDKDDNKDFNKAIRDAKHKGIY